ncbi:MAG: hypothetical protein WCI55_10340 [Armatimonadota bacterium]
MENCNLHHNHSIKRGTRRYGKYFTPGKVIGIAVLLFVVVPTCMTLKYGGEATLTIETDKEVPFEFVLAPGKGSDDGALLVDCRISVNKGIGKFVTGSRENMDAYGFPAIFFTRYSRRLVVEIVNRHGEIEKQRYSNGKKAIHLETRDDPSAPNGKRYFVLADNP